MSSAKKAPRARRIRVPESERINVRVYVLMKKAEVERLDNIIIPALSPDQKNLLTRNAAVRALVNTFSGKQA